MLRVENLKINSQNSKMSLIENASFDVLDGEVVLLEGSNGSGKSTILNTIMGHPDYKIESGNIFIGDINITNKDTTEIAKLGVFLSMQHATEIEGVSTIKMLYGSYKNLNNIKRENEDTKIKEKSITDFKKDLEEKCESFGLDSSLLLRDLNIGFSGGQKKQAELMHMLALEPKVILLDEPDSGVDKESLIKVFDVIKYFKSNGASILITSHNEKIKNEIVDRVYRLENKIIV